MPTLTTLGMSPARWVPGRYAMTGALAAGALVLAGLAASAPAQATSGQAAHRVPVAGTRPAWAVAANRVALAPPSSERVQARVYLAPRDPAGLAAVAAAVSTPGNPLYRHFLSAAQIRARFGQSATRIGMLVDWLRQSGLRVTTASNHVPDGYISVTGSLAAASR
ncbi:MAG: protease pro-enzyme activation domain-containing protein, partial [Streptosporangiaceae bacterium]